MKKLFFSVAIIAAFASCSKNEVSDIAPAAAATSIGFTTLNSNATRYASDNQTDYDYVVLSRSSDEAATDWYIYDVIDSDSNTAENGPYYWPTTGVTLDFIGFSPADESFYSTVVSNSNIGINDYEDGQVKFVFQSQTGAVDFTAATPLLAKTKDNTGGTVALQFEHMLAKVQVNISISEEMTEAGYALEAGASSAINVDYSRGIYTFDMDSPFLKTDLDGTEIADEYTFYHIDSPSDAQEILMQEVTNGGETNCVPQPATGCEIVLYNLVITKDGGAFYDQGTGTENAKFLAYKIQEADIANNYFKEGYKYIVNLEIVGGLVSDEILFNASITPWITSGEGVDLSYGDEDNVEL